MSKTSELDVIFTELEKCGKALAEIATELRKLFGGTGTDALSGCEEIYNPEKEEPQTEEQPVPVPTIDRPTVKAKLAELMKQGLSAEVKELLQSHGAERFSEIQDEDLPALMKEAETIGT